MTDFNFYSESFFGDKIPEEEFAYYEKSAADRLSAMTQGRCDEADEATKFAVCAVAEILFATDGRIGVSSESSDGFSAAYKGFESEIYKAAAQYLPSSLFYRGC